MVTARSESKAKDFTERRSRFKDLLEVVVTGDLSAIGAFDNLAKDVDVIIHCASVSRELFYIFASGLPRMNRIQMVERFHPSSIHDHDLHTNPRHSFLSSVTPTKIKNLTSTLPIPSHS